MSGVEALVGILRQHEDQTDRSATDGCICGYPDPRTFPEHLAERILADPGPLLAALAEAGVLAKQRKEWQDDIGDDSDVRLAASERRQVRPGLYEYVDPRPIRYVSDWRPADD